MRTSRFGEDVCLNFVDTATGGGRLWWSSSSTMMMKSADAAERLPVFIGQATAPLYACFEQAFTRWIKNGTP